MRSSPLDHATLFKIEQQAGSTIIPLLPASIRQCYKEQRQRLSKLIHLKMQQLLRIKHTGLNSSDLLHMEIVIEAQMC